MGSLYNESESINIPLLVFGNQLFNLYHSGFPEYESISTTPEDRIVPFYDTHVEYVNYVENTKTEEC